LGRKVDRARGNAWHGAWVEAKSGRRLGDGVLHGPAGVFTGRRAEELVQGTPYAYGAYLEAPRYVRVGA
jgi:hypothetical protein